MTQKDKQLLLTDLCGRLPYGVNVKTTGDNESYTLLSINPNKNIALIGLDFGDVYATSKIKIDEVKPYLRSMSSMTEEESAELLNIISEWFDKELFYLTEEPFLEYALSRINYSISPLLFDWLNAHHFDYRGLIDKGLALETPEDMY